MNTRNIAIVVLILILGGAWYVSTKKSPPAREGDGATAQQQGSVSSMRVMYLNATPDMIRVDQPLPGGVIVSDTFTVSGRAQGGWYFEADFPLELRDKDGNQLLIQPVMAQGEWMTPELVPFASEVTVPGTYQGPATLILHNHNASGLPEHEKSVSIPIIIE